MAREMKSPSAFRLKKSERLSSRKRIEALFARGRRGGSGPVRFCYTEELSEDKEAGARFCPQISVLFSVPKKAFKRAWKRNLIKRRMKESYRQRKSALTELLAARERHLDLALICSADEIPDYKTIDEAIARILEQLAAKV